MSRLRFVLYSTALVIYAPVYLMLATAGGVLVLYGLWQAPGLHTSFWAASAGILAFILGGGWLLVFLMKLTFPPAIEKN